MDSRFSVKFLFGIVSYLSIFIDLSQSARDSYSLPDGLLLPPGFCPQQPARCLDITQINCINPQYRTFDGTCNNPLNPTIGVALTSYARILEADYHDGISELRRARDGTELPSARLLSYQVFGRKRVPDRIWSLINMQWGQVVTHDISLRAPDGFGGLKPLEAREQQCCTVDGHYVTHTTTVPCQPISVPQDDPFFTERECIDFDRTVTEKDQKCPGSEDPEPAEQLNGVTHFFDLNVIYGNSEAASRNLRTLRSGLLKAYFGGGEFPPHANRQETESLCSRAPDEKVCYVTGDVRANQNPGQITLQTLLLREHNRIARNLAAINPHWPDERIFQETRRINIAQFQHITYYEWALDFFGKERMKKHRLIYETKKGEYVNDYNPCVDARTLQSFAHAGFRVFHNQIFGLLKLYSERRRERELVLRLSEFLDKPGHLEKRGRYEDLIRGLVTQPQKKTDDNLDLEANELFTLGDGNRGRDLRAFDIQRSRDHGLANYNAFRAYCGLPRATNFTEFSDYISKKDIKLLQKLYTHPDDVDLMVGGSLEKLQPDSLLGPTFLCIHFLQFHRSRVGDRYFYENGDQPHPFTNRQLAEIRKASVSRLLCDNSKIKSIQANGFRLISERNPLKKCEYYPTVDLNKWRDNTCGLINAIKLST